MKKLIPPLLLSLIFLSNCTEEIIKIVEVTKDSLIYIHDSVPAPNPERIFIGADSILTPMEVPNPGDPDRPYIIYIYVIDSFFVEVIKHDTVEIHHYDSMFTYLGKHHNSYDSLLTPIITEFYDRCAEYGVQPLGEFMVYIRPWLASDFPPDNRSSFGIYLGGHWVILLREGLSIDESYTPLFREFAKHHLYHADWTPYSYSHDPDDIMNPAFDPKRLKLSSSDDEKKPFLDELFKQPI